jgi:hypothetical protein
MPWGGKYRPFRANVLDNRPMDCFSPLPEPALHFGPFTFYFLLLPAIVQPGIVVLAADVGQGPWKGIVVFIDVA